MLRALALPLLIAAGLAGCMTDEAPVEGASLDASANATTNLTAEVPAVTLTVATSGIYPINPGFAQAALEAVENANVTVEFTNADPNPVVAHDWVLEGVDGAATEAVGSGESSTVTFVAPAAGEYAFFCSVGNHRQLGMEGTFTVKAAA